MLDGENHKITGLKAPLFGQLSGTVSNVAIDAGAIEIGNSVDTTVGIFANTMTNATVEKVMIANGSISSTAGKAAGFAGTVTDSTVKNIFIQGRVNAVSTASGFAETSHHSVMENIYANIDVNGADGAGFLVNSTGENSYKNICSIGNVAENMYKLAKTDITFTNAYELSAADGISSAAEANGVKTIGKEVWTKAFYTETLALQQKRKNVAKRLSAKFNKLWVGAEVMLFVLVGATVDIRYAVSAGVVSIVLIFAVLVFRMLGVFLCLLKTKLTMKERMFCVIAYMPKATVQAAIGGVPLAMGLSCGNIVLTVAVTAILITAPLGAFLIEATYKKWLGRQTEILSR